jgi:hypothetical protein
MKQRFSLLNRDQHDVQPIDFNHLSDYTVTHYVDDNRQTVITDDIIRMLIDEAEQEGIAMRAYPDNDLDDLDSRQQQQQQTDQHAQPLSIAPAFDRPLSSISSISHADRDDD